LEENDTADVQLYKPLDLPHDTISVTVIAILAATELVIKPCNMKGSEVMYIMCMLAEL
jgi:hypothetical protein